MSSSFEPVTARMTPGIIAVFAIFGPMMGGAFFILVMVFQTLIDPIPDAIATLALASLFAIPLSIPFGFIPALLTGILAAFLARRVDLRIAFPASCALAGFVASAAFWWLFTRQVDWPLVFFGVCGGGSGFACATIVQWLLRSPAEA